jgi:pyridoxine 4-dehydrogenase
VIESSRLTDRRALGREPERRRRGADGSWIPATSPDELTQAVHVNLCNLGLEMLDVVNLHSMFDVHGPPEGSLEEPFTVLTELQREGLVHHIGLSYLRYANANCGRTQDL